MNCTDEGKQYYQCKCNMCTDGKKGQGYPFKHINLSTVYNFFSDKIACKFSKNIFV